MKKNPVKCLFNAKTKNRGNASPKLCPAINNFVIDIDGVVCEDIPNEEPQRMVTAREIPGARKQINEWYDQGHIITFFTARTAKHRKITADWLEEHGFKYHNLIVGKPRGGNYHYIDDKRVRATIFKGEFGKLGF